MVVVGWNVENIDGVRITPLVGLLYLIMYLMKVESKKVRSQVQG